MRAAGAACGGAAGELFPGVGSLPGALPAARRAGAVAGGTEWEEEPGEAPAPRSLSAGEGLGSHLPLRAFPAVTAAWGAAQGNPRALFPETGSSSLAIL